MGWVLWISYVCILNMPWLFTCGCICDVMGAIKGSREILSRIVNSGVRKITPFGMSSQVIVVFKNWQQCFSFWKYKEI